MTVVPMRIRCVLWPMALIVIQAWPGMPFIRLPCLEVITYSEQIECRLVRSDTGFGLFGHVKLLIRRFKTDLSCEP
jgi:hypothetical protein